MRDLQFVQLRFERFVSCPSLPCLFVNVKYWRGRLWSQHIWRRQIRLPPTKKSFPPKNDGNATGGSEKMGGKWVCVVRGKKQWGSPLLREREKEGVKGGRKNNPFDKSQQIFGPRREGYFFSHASSSSKLPGRNMGAAPRTT